MRRWLICSGLSLANVVVIASETSMIDEKKLLEYRKKTTVAGVYLEVWNRLHDHLEKTSNIRLNDYIVTFDEDEKQFSIKLSKPFKEPVLGGGVGTCTVDKKSYEVQCNLIK